MPAIIFASLRLSRIADGMEPHPAEFTQEEIFLMCQKLIAIIAENYPMTGFGLYLQCVLAINFLKQSKTKVLIIYIYIYSLRIWHMTFSQKR